MADSNYTYVSADTAPTMTSLELVAFINDDRRAKAEDAGADFPSKGFAELAHADFLKKVPEVLGSEHAGNFSCKFDVAIGNGATRNSPGYRFPKREACLMAMSYSYELQAKVFDRMTLLEAGAQPTIAPRPKLTPISLKAETDALKAILGDDDLKQMAPLLWQELSDAAQNALRHVIGSTLALPAQAAPALLDVVEIAKLHGIHLPHNLRGAAGKYVKARCAATETERLINGSIRKSSAYADHSAVAEALREYMSSRGAA